MHFLLVLLKLYEHIEKKNIDGGSISWVVTALVFEISFEAEPNRDLSDCYFYCQI